MEKTRDREIIRDLNDGLRRTFIGGRVVMTAGVNALEEETKAAVIDKVRAFDAFAPDNDPHGEHDFGNFTHDGQRFFWKIDYFDHALEFGSPDPSDPKITTRVLTIMLADEY